MNEGEQYAELAKAVYAAAAREHWNTDKVFQMLNNPVDFVKYTEMVSFNQSVLEWQQARVQEEREETNPVVSRMEMDIKKREF